MNMTMPGVKELITLIMAALLSIIVMIFCGIMIGLNPSSSNLAIYIPIMTAVFGIWVPNPASAAGLFADKPEGGKV